MSEVLDRLAALVDRFRARAAELDRHSAFPADNIADLAEAGALAAPIPRHLGGMGAGTEPEGAMLALDMLRVVGRGHLATGRLFEAHLNALKLLTAYGTPALLDDVARDVQAGRLHGLWVTEASHGLRIVDGVLHGGKTICSGAGHVRRALVTAQPDHGEPVLVLLALDDRDRATPGAMRLSGMRSAATGAVDLTGLPGRIVGQAGDYLRQPEFSAGAWRTSAVTVGGLESLVALVREELVARGRSDSPNQLERVGRMLIAQQTALMWVRRAARLAEERHESAGDVAAGVNLARIAVEQAALDIVQATQRCLGLSAFAVGHPAESLMRDLSTYLRQPAPDETLSEAAGWHMQRDMPA